MKSYVVIGLGRFGEELALQLYGLGEEVLAIDMDEGIVDRIADRVTRAVAADARDLEILKRLGVENFDRAIVAVGTDLAASALITMNLKALNIPFILCKARDNTYRAILEKLGADRVIIPEREVADKLALGLTHTGVMEFIELSDEYGIVETAPAEEWVGKSIRQLEFRSRYNANVIAIRQGDRITIPPAIDEPISRDCAMVLLGSYKMMDKLKKE